MDAGSSGWERPWLQDLERLGPPDRSPSGRERCKVSNSAAERCNLIRQTIFVVDDDPAARDSLVFLLRAHGMASRGFASAQAFLDKPEELQGDCLITDVRMPGMDGLSLVRLLQERATALPIIVVTGHADVSLAVDCMKAGVADFLEKPFSADDLLRALGVALEKGEGVEARRRWREKAVRRRAALSPREDEVLELLTQGLSNKAVAQKLELSPRTVESHRANVMAKMEAGSLSELVRIALASPRS